MIRKILTAALLSFGLLSGAQAQTTPGHGAAGQIYVGQGAARPTWKTMIGDCTLASSGAITCSGVSGTVSGNPTFTGTVTFTGTLNDTGLFQIGGTTQTFPVSGQLVGVGDTQVLTNKSIDASEINSGTMDIARLPVGTDTTKGILQGDSSTITITAGAISCTVMSDTQIGCAKVDNSTIVIAGGALTAVGAVAASVGIGTTGVTLGTPGDILSVGAGPTLAQVATTGTGNVVLAASPTLSGTIAGNLTFSGNLTMSGLAVPGTIGGSLCASAGGAVYYFSGSNCFGAGVTALNSLTGNIVLSPVVSASGTSITLPVPRPSGRLTLQSGTPVMTTSQTTKGTLYYDCYQGSNLVPIYNGTIDTVLPIGSCEISTAMSAAGASALNQNSVFDAWAINFSGTLTLCIATNGASGGWASDTGGSNTVRGTGYSQLDLTTRPYITNKNALAHCYNGTNDRGSISANQATYLGTIATDLFNSGKVTYQFGGIASGGTAGVFNVWNAYNRTLVSSNIQDNGGAYTYSSSVIRTARDSSESHFYAVFGMAEDGVTLSYTQQVSTSAGAIGRYGFTVNSEPFLDFYGMPGLVGASSLNAAATTASIAPMLGVLQTFAIEQGNGAGTTTWNNAAFNATFSILLRM